MEEVPELLQVEVPLQSVPMEVVQMEGMVLLVLLVAVQIQEVLEVLTIAEVELEVERTPVAVVVLLSISADLPELLAVMLVPLLVRGDLAPQLTTQ